MKPKVIASAIAALLAISMLAPSGASAATEFGDTCGAVGTTEGDTLVQLSKNPATPPGIPATSSGVITSWKVSVALPLEGESFPSKLKVM